MVGGVCGDLLSRTWYTYTSVTYIPSLNYATQAATPVGAAMHQENVSCLLRRNCSWCNHCSWALLLILSSYHSLTIKYLTCIYSVQVCACTTHSIYIYIHLMAGIQIYIHPLLLVRLIRSDQYWLQQPSKWRRARAYCTVCNKQWCI
jgi:hypothetical protein